MRRRVLAAVAALIVGTSAGCGPLLVWEGRDDLRRRQVALLEQHGQQYVRVDGVEGRRYRAVGLEGLTFAPDGRRLAYPALRADGWVVVVDGVESAPYDGIGGVVFSPDGAHIAYSAEVAGRWLVVHDGRRGSRWDALVRRTLGFGADQRLSYAASQMRSVHVVVDGHAGPAFDAVSELVRAARSGQVAYIAHRGANCGVVVEGGDVPPTLELERCVGLTASSTGVRWAYAAWREGCSRLFLDRVEVTDSCGVEPASIRFAGDERLAYTRREGAQTWAVIDGEAHGPYESTEPVVFAASGPRWGFVARQEGRSVVFIDGAPRASHRTATNLALSDDGGHLVYVAADDGRSFVVHDGRHFAQDAVMGGTLVLSDDGRHWACLVGEASTERMFISVDGRFVRALPFEEIAARMAQGLDAEAIAAALRQTVRAELVRSATVARR